METLSAFFMCLQTAQDDSVNLHSNLVWVIILYIILYIFCKGVAGEGRRDEQCFLVLILQLFHCSVDNVLSQT